MPNERFSKDIGVYYSPTIVAPDWKRVICTNDKSLNFSVDNVEINNDCTGNYLRNLPSTVSWTMDVSGDASTSPTASEMSIEEIFDIATSRTVGYWKFETLDGTYYREGEGYISDYTEGATTPEYQTFDFTITSSGALSNVVPT